jgi:hypothetical protein
VARRVAFSGIVAGCCALILASQVYVRVERVRLKVVTSPERPALGQPVVVAIPEVSRLAGRPVAIVLHIGNSGAEPRNVRIALGGTPLATARVGSNSDVRVDLSVPASRSLSKGDRLELAGDGEGWALTYLELANIHGFSQGLINFVVVPASARSPWAAPLFLSVLTLAVLVMLPLTSLWRAKSRTVRIVHRSAAAPVLIFFVAALVARRVSPYGILMSLQTFLLGVAILYYPALQPIDEQAILRLPFALQSGWTAFVTRLRLLEPHARRLRIPAPMVVALLAIATVVVGIMCGTNVAGGADSYGYVSQSELWLTGHLKIVQPWMADAPWPSRRWTFTPLGYRPLENEWAIVPTYAPGLPLLMAGARLVGGPCAVFWVVPFSGAVLVLATYGLGRQLSGPAAGVPAAWLVATSPVFLKMLAEPMTDVPVAAGWAAAFYFVFEGTLPGALAGGLAAGIAILIRPNLAPLAGVAALWLIWRISREEKSRRGSRVCALAAFIVSVVPGVLATAAIQTYLYGSPFSSGYGTVDSIFDRTRFFPNLKNYAQWLSSTQTPLALLGLVAVLLPFRWLWRTPQDRSKVAAGGMVVVVVWVTYCFYLVFDDAGYLRFLLTAWPFVMIGVVLLLQLPARSRVWGAALLPSVGALALGLWGINTAYNGHAFDSWKGEVRYPAVARLVRNSTPERSIIFAMQHSGSVRYYGGRMTFRYDTLDADWLDRAVQWFAAQDIHPYLLVDNWEIPQFLSRFDGQATTGVLDGRPLFVYRDPGTVHLYDLLNRRDTSAPVGTFSGSGSLSRCPLPEHLSPLTYRPAPP